MAYRKKAATLLAEGPGIVVVPECECPERLHFPAGTEKPADRAWFGANPNKGLGVFSYGPYRFRVLREDHEQFRTVVPIEVTGGAIDFTLFAVWANNPTDKDGPYVTQVWKALQLYRKLLTAGPVVLAGDFNSNTIWDRPRREGNHSALVELLAANGIGSVYHQHFDCAQGKELHPTHYLYRHADKPYHLDYCFASNDLLERIRSVAVGAHADWAPWSDHVPLIIDFEGL